MSQFSKDFLHDSGKITLYEVGYRVNSSIAGKVGDFNGRRGDTLSLRAARGLAALTYKSFFDIVRAENQVTNIVRSIITRCNDRHHSVSGIKFKMLEEVDGELSFTLASNGELTTLKKNFSYLINDFYDEETSSEIDPEYEQFLADVWVGIVLTLMVLCCVCCMCSCLLYHKFQQWKRSGKLCCFKLINDKWIFIFIIFCLFVRDYLVSYSKLKLIIFVRLNYALHF